MTRPGHEPDAAVGFRLAQAGAVFVPELDTRVWLVDPPATGPAAAPLADVAAVSAPPGQLPPARIQDQLPDRSALLPYLPVTGSDGAERPAGKTPLVVATVMVDGPVEQVRACVAGLLDSDEPELRIQLVAGGEASAPAHRPAAVEEGDPAATVEPGSEALRRLAAEFGDSPRVTLVDDLPTSGRPAPYLLRVPSGLRVSRHTVRKLLVAAEYWQVGLIRVLPAGAGNPAHALELWSTSAVERALAAGVPAAELPAMIATTHGARWEAGEEYGLTDVTQQATRAASAPTRRPAEPSAVERVRDLLESGGLRSLARTALLVARNRIQPDR